MPSAVRKSGAPCGPGTTRSVQALSIAGGASAWVSGGAASSATAAMAERVALAQRAAAEAGRGERRAAAHDERAVDPAAHEHVRAQARAADRAELEHAAGRQVQRGPLRGRLAVDLHDQRRARDGDDRVVVEAQPRAGQRELDPRRALGVADEPVPSRNERASIGPDGGTPTSQ